MKTTRIYPLVVLVTLGGCVTRRDSSPPNWVSDQSRALSASREIIIRELWLQNIPLPEAIHAVNDRLGRSRAKIRLAVELDDGAVFPPSNPTPEMQEKLIYIGYTAVGLQDIVREIGEQTGYSGYYSGEYVTFRKKVSK